MDPLYLSADFPRLCHVTEAGSWTNIERRGLLSTTALLDLFEVTAETRRQLEEEHRPESVRIEHPLHGGAVIRDQKPPNMKRPAGWLTGMTTTEWLRELNRRVFFWPSEKRLNTLLQAEAYRDRAHEVLVIDTRQLVERSRRQILLSAINSGATGQAGARFVNAAANQLAARAAVLPTSGHGGQSIQSVVVCDLDQESCVRGGDAGTSHHWLGLVGIPVADDS